MKALNCIKLFLICTVIATSFSSCEVYEETLYDRIIGRTWIGDLGFSYKGAPVKSWVTFKANDYALDEQFYYNTYLATTLPVRWWISGNTIYLDYGKEYPMLEIRYADIHERYLTGTLFVDGANDGNIEFELYD